MAMNRPPSLTTRCVLHAVRLECVLRCRSKWWFLHKTLVRTTGSIVKLSLKPLFHGLIGIAASQLCDAFITQLPFLVHREGRALDCGDLPAFPNKVSSQAEHVSFL